MPVKTSIYISNEVIQSATMMISGTSVNITDIKETVSGEGCIINGIITDINSLSKNLSVIKPSSKNIKLVVDSSSVITRLIEAPPIKNRKKLMLFLYDSFHDIENYENMLLDYMIFEEKTSSGHLLILAVLAEKDFIAQYIELFNLAGMKIKSIDTALSCIIKYAFSIENLKGKTYVLAVADGNTMLFLLFIKGQYKFSKRIRIISENYEDISQELLRAMLNIIEFNKSEKNGEIITDFYFGGIKEKYPDIYNILSENADIKVSSVPEPSAIKNISGKTLEKFIYIVGNIL